jgi:hypothetical protein
MNSPMARILGVEAIESDRKLPGTEAVAGREFCYVADPGQQPFPELFRALVRQVEPPRMKSGGALVEGCAIELPDAQVLQAVSYKGDLAGWRAQLSEGAKALGLLTGRIEGDSIKLDDGRSFAVADCKVRFD